MARRIVNNLKSILVEKLKWHTFPFPPELANYGFYPKRWWDLLNNNTDMRLDEADALAKYFDIEISELIKERIDETRDIKVS